jgi:hypothetical protein
MKKWMLRLGPVLSLLVLFGLYLLAKDTLPQAALGLPRTAEDRPIKVEVVKTAVVPAGPSLSQVRDELKLAIGSLPLAAVKDELKAEIAQLRQDLATALDKLAQAKPPRKTTPKASPAPTK